jgi:hypothetical protein
MDITKIQAAVDSGKATITTTEAQEVRPSPMFTGEETVTISHKRWDMYDNTKELDPEVEVFRLPNVERQIADIDNQMASLQIRKDALLAIKALFPSQVKVAVESFKSEPLDISG